ncbi:hypothetical protein ES708_18690 [subsurface metagenome]
MAEVIDPETKTHDTHVCQLLTIALQVAEHDRTQRLKGTITEGRTTAAIVDDRLSMCILERHANTYVIAAYNSHRYDGKIIYLPDLLNHAHAWILRYDSHHAKWSVEASNFETSNAEFFRLVQQLKRS